MSSFALPLRNLILVLVSATLTTQALAQNPSPAPMATPVREADAVCANCHNEIYRKYLDTPMANASGLASDRVFTGVFHHAQSGIDYRLSNKNDSLWLNYSRPADPGLQGSQKLDYFLGSGHL